MAGSEDGRAALQPAANLAIALAAPGQGGVHLTHVVPATLSAQRASKATAVAQVTQASQNMAGEYLDSTLRQFSSGLREVAGSNLVLARSLTVNDDIAQGIISVAENGGAGGEEVFGGCEVIAMTTHGYSGRQHWVGSVTEHVLDTSRVPLLIVQPG